MNYSSSFSYKIHELTYSIDMLADNILRENSDINLPQFLIILCFIENSGQTQKFASEWLQLTEATVSYMVKRVSQKGYLIIKKDKNDSRNKKIYATRNGVNLIASVYPILEASLEKHLSIIPQAQVEQMKKNMSLVKNNIEMSNYGKDHKND